MQGHPKVTGFALPTVRDELAWVSGVVARWPFPVTVTADPEQKHRAFVDAVAAVAVTGTVTLELALAAVPMVTTYIADRSQAAAAEKYKLRFAALPNILLGEALVPEITGLRVEPQGVIAAARALLDDPRQIDTQRAGFTRIREAMLQGLPNAPMVDAAEVLLGYFRLLRGT
jgi:lipid-A-disaccharide synthase